MRNRFWWNELGAKAGMSLALLLLAAAVAFGQAGEADISGSVTDPSGAIIPNAQVTLTNAETGVARTVTTQDGRFDFSPVSPGTYNITVKAANFQTENITHLVINIGVHVTEDVAMKVGNAEQTVEVTGAVPVVDTSSQSVSDVIDQLQITTLPISSREYLNLALLEPGTSQDATRTFYNNVQVGGGGYFYANGFMIDGVRNTWAEQGEPRQNFPEGAVQEFKVYVNEYPAEYGLYMGGLVTVDTKSGTNNFHGEAFEYWRNEALNHDNKFQQAAEAAEHTGNPFNRNQFGGDIGGPIITDRTHFYAAYERTQTASSYTIFTSQPQDYGSNQGTFNQPLTDQMLTGRVDHQISNNQSIFVRYAQEWNKLTFQGCGGNSEVYCYDGLIPRHSLVAGDTWMLTPSIVNDFRFQYAYSSYQLGPPGHIWTDVNTMASNPAATAQLQIAYIFPSYSYGAGYQEDGVEQRYEGSDVVSVQKGTHSFRFGFDVNYIPFTDATAFNVQGTFYFGTDQVFNPSDPSTIAALTDPILFEASIPTVVNSVPTWELGFFAMDDWKIRPSLTLNLGLRYDRELGSFNENLNPNSFSQPIPFIGDPSKRGDDNNFGPRVGIVWDPFHNGRDVIRAGYGLYYNNIQTLLNFNEIRNLSECNIIISNPSYPDPYNGLNPTSFCSTAPQNVTVLAPNYRNPYSNQFGVGYTRAFSNNFAVKVDGIYQHLFRDFRNVDLNYPDPVTGLRPLPAWGAILQQQSTAQSKYKALFVRADKRFSHRYTFTVAYTLAYSTDDNPQFSITNYADPNQDWGPSNVNRRNSIVASGTVNLPWSFTFGAIWTARSSVPFSALAAAFNADGTQQYVPGTTRNQGNRNLNLTAVNAYRATLGLSPITASQINTNPYDSFDLHLSRSFSLGGERRLEVIAQVFNLFGHENLAGVSAGTSGYDTNAASAGFGTLGSAGNLQQAELAGRFVF
ncbi:MAG: TonB-dependent receptor [Candidatus Acidiferrales bacterium]